ncbi:MAG: hypothetical protein GY885_09015, partial [Phycisphaeraceae bacterium]|nr:hypothetical protein [Phycisphaeraceae bacterium]
VLPREPRLVGVAGDADGPVAVFLPSQRAARGIDRERDESPMPAEDAAVDDATEKVDDASSPADEEPEADLDGGATFLIGSTNRWKWSVESPPLEFLQVRDAVIGVGGTPEGVRPVMAWTDDRDGDAARLSTWEEGGWRSRSFKPAPATRPLAIVESEGGVLLASRTESGDVLLDYVRPGDGDDLSLLRLG